MALQTAAYIGLTDGLDNANVESRADVIELQNGLAKMQHPRELTFTGAKTKKFGNAYGIMANDCPFNQIFGSGIALIESATWTRTEEISERQMVANTAYAAASGFNLPDGSKFIMLTQNMIWTGYTETFALTIRHSSDISAVRYLRPGARIGSGSGEVFAITPAVINPPYAPGSGDVLQDMVTAIEALATSGDPYIVYNPTTYEFDKHLIVRSVRKTLSSNDWHTFDIELSRTVAVDSDACADSSGISPLYSQLTLWGSGDGWTVIGGDTGGATYEDENQYMPTKSGLGGCAFYQIGITVTLAAGQNPTRTENITWFPSDEEMSFISGSLI